MADRRCIVAYDINRITLSKTATKTGGHEQTRTADLSLRRHGGEDQVRVEIRASQASAQRSRAQPALLVASKDHRKLSIIIKSLTAWSNCAATA
jgi:hypothetical protein